MFERLKILKDSAEKLYPYFYPTYKNSVRTIGCFAGLVLIPFANFLMPLLFIKEKDNREEDTAENFDVLSTLASVAAVALLSGAQQALSTMLATSTIQAMRERNVKLLMDTHSKFLMHGDNKDIISLQNVTVGVGVRDFTWSAVPILFSLPMYVITSVSTIINIGLATGSFLTSGVVLSFLTASAVAMYISNERYYFYQANNQKIENDLVAKVAFIEAQRGSIHLMRAADKEYAGLKKQLQEIDASINKLSMFDFSNGLIISITTAVASQFLGDYYKYDSIKDVNNPNAKVLNLMLMSLISNVQNAVWILTASYSFVKLNLEQLNVFDQSYRDCVSTHNTYNKMKQECVGDHLSLLKFCAYKPNTEYDYNAPLSPIFDHVTLNLLPNKVYKLSAKSGSGKTTFLKAITNNWQYTEGVVKLPYNAKDKMCFVPQNSFIPSGTLLEILIYPLTKEDFLANYQFSLIYKAKSLLTEVKLLPWALKEDEIEAENINWAARLSGGEKQKIGVIRSILIGAEFIIMDEAATALDEVSKKTVYDVLKKYISSLENYTVIYTDHADFTDFADAILTISGQSLDCHYM